MRVGRRRLSLDVRLTEKRLREFAEPFFSLEPDPGRRFLPSVNRDDLRVGVSAGILAATATAGALIAIGSRSSSAARPFNVIASHLIGAGTAEVYGFVSSVTVPGVVLHVILTTAMGVAVAYVARRRIMPAWLAATVFALLAALVSVGIARRGGSSLARLLAVGDLLVFYVILAASLALGIRFAFFDRAKDRSRHDEPM